MDKYKSFEAMLETNNKKKPLALYYAKENHATTSYSNILKPKDVIATVSKQLKEIQKADSFKKEYVRKTVKAKQTDFIPVNDLYSQEGLHYHVTKFETQCVTDTQLIDIVDNVEAMVNVNSEMSQDIHKSSDHVVSNLKVNTIEGINVASLCNKEDNFNTESNFNQDSKDKRQDYNLRNELDEINTDICYEFDTSYSGTHKDIISMKRTTKMLSMRSCNVEISKCDIAHTIESDNANYYRDNYSSSNNNKLTKEPLQENINNMNSNMGTEPDMFYRNNDDTNKEKLSNILLHKFDTDSNVKNDCYVTDEKDHPSSPVFNSFKTIVNSTKLSPLIYTLESFEKFESLAMPLMEENIDFETAKYFINSQIIDNQLHISTNGIPILTKSTDNLVFQANYCNKDMLEDIPNKEDNVDTSIEIKQIANKSTSFQDEILFSSDEENDYFQYCSKDLPTTCAIETSFSESELDLNETVFVGFQTSSDKCIQVSKNSFIKAKRMLDDIDKFKNVNLTLTELVDIYDSNVSNCNNNFPSEQISNKEECKKDFDTNRFITGVKTVTTATDNTEVLEEAELIRFETGSKWSIDISDKPLIKCNAVIQDIKENIDGTTDNSSASNIIAKKEEFVGFKTASNKRIEVSEESLKKTNNIFDNIDFNLNNVTLDMGCKIRNANQEEIQSIGDYKTPMSLNSLGEKKCDINDDDVNIIDQTLLQEFENESIEETICKDNEINCKEVQALVDFKRPETSLKNNKNSLNDKDLISDSNRNENFDPGIANYFTVPNIPQLRDSSKFLGFKTANNKVIELSSEALAKTKDLFHDIEFEDLSKCERNLDNMFGYDFTESDFSIGNSGNKTDIISIAYSKLDSISNINQSEKEISSPIFLGFKTANNNVVKISKEALLSTKKIFHDIDSKSICKDDNLTASNIPQLQETPDYLGFRTANNKEIKVSSEALAKTKDLLYNIAIENLSCHEKNYDNPFRCSSKENKEMTSKYHVHKSGSELPAPVFQGFTTASSKVINISKEALLKTKNVFDDIDSIGIVKDDISTKKIGYLNHNVNSLNKNKKIHHLTSAEGFKSLNNETDSVNMVNKINSVKTMHPNMCSNNKEQLTHRSNKIVCQGVASNVEKLKKDNLLNTDTTFQGFKTANNMPVVISEESLMKSRKIFENIDDVGNNNDVHFVNDIHVNLKTASKSDIKTELIDNIVRHNSLDYPNHKMTSYKKAAILEDSLAVIKEVNCETNISLKVKNENLDYLKSSMHNVSYNSSEVINEKRKNNFEGFKGFKTASHKRVKVSDEAIARSRKIFDEINFDIKTDSNALNRDISLSKESVNKENVKYEREKDNKSEESRLKTADDEQLNKLRYLYSDFDNDLKTTNKQCEYLKINTLDTQLLNNFEETLHTEDFYKDTTPKQCKRSGSPILSCPKAKKRKKFETPYRTDTIIENSIKQKVVYGPNKKPDVKYEFSKNYKNSKSYFLNQLDNIDENKCSAVIDSYILNFDFDTLLQFEFEGSRNDFTNVRWTTDSIKTCFVEAVDNKIIPEGWLDNHIKLILWKLISYEVRFPNAMRGVCSVKNVLEQLKYRYDKELYSAERPALRKVLEKDDVSTRTMILAVVGIYVDGIKVHSITNTSKTVELLVTDGWYCVKASTDRMIYRLVSEGKIVVGRKIATVGAELMNCEQGISPWEDTSAVRLKIFGNSTRPARWDARLGFQANGSIFTKLSTIEPSGGKVCKTRALVLRVYPSLYVEKLEDGSTVTRSERLEHLHQIKYETEREIQLEKLYEEVEREYFDQESSGSEGMDNDLLKNLQSGSQLNRRMKKSNDPSQFRSYLSDSQALLLQEYSSKTKEKIVEELQKRVRGKIEEQGLHFKRNVISLLKIRVAGLEDAEDVKVSKAMISIWRPTDAILDVVKEGAWIDLFNIIPTGVRNSEIQMSAGRQSIFHRSKYKENDRMKPKLELLQRKCFTTKDLNKNPTIHTDFNEIDTIGVVFLIEPSVNDFEMIKAQQFQNVYITDIDKNFICINFWGGIKKFGYENIFDTGNVVACANLQKRAGNTRKTIPQYRATELSVFTKSPKLDHVRSMSEELIKKLSGLDKRKFLDDCVLLKNNYAIFKHNSEFSPYRFNTSDYSLTKNKLFIDSPLAQTKDLNLNLTGLDFESTFKQVDSQEFSPAVLKQKQVVKDKIAKLKMYGEPPPLSKIYIVNKSKNAGSAYKSPLTNNVAREKILDNSPVTTNQVMQSSPIITLNRTFLVKPGMNPVKLNFSATSVGDEKIESNPFEEEFEASPPLSLD